MRKTLPPTIVGILRGWMKSKSVLHWPRASSGVKGQVDMQLSTGSLLYSQTISLRELLQAGWQYIYHPCRTLLRVKGSTIDNYARPQAPTGVFPDKLKCFYPTYRELTLPPLMGLLMSASCSDSDVLAANITGTQLLGEQKLTGQTLWQINMSLSRDEVGAGKNWRRISICPVEGTLCLRERRLENMSPLEGMLARGQL